MASERQAGRVAGHSRKKLVGADAPNPKNTKTPGLTVGSFSAVLLILVNAPL